MSFDDFSYEYRRENGSISVTANRLMCEVVEGVRISPPFIKFTNPYEGKKYQAEIVLLNTGKKPALIRIEKPNCSAIKMIADEHEKFLACGMLIKKIVSYISTINTLVDSCLIPIHINKATYNFKIEMKPAEVILTFNPTILDFGCVDAGPTVTKRTIELVNSGAKAARFCVDLASKELKINVLPMKGVIPGGGRITFHVEMTALQAGKFKSELWVISPMPLCVQIIAHVFYGKLEPIHKYALKDFTFIYFPRTYFGLNCYKAMLVKNDSNLSCMFCITGELEEEACQITEVVREDPDYNFFKILPNSGLLAEKDTRPFMFIFSPQPRLRFKENNDYAMATIRINKLYCTVLNADDYEGPLFEIEKSRDSKDDAPMTQDTLSYSSSVGIVTTNPYDSSSENDESTASIPQLEMYFESYIRVILHGEAEYASVSILPDELVLTDLTIHELEKRVLQMKNNSTHLPIICRYKKILFVEVEPNTFPLEPKEKREISILISPHSYDTIQDELSFDLLYYDSPSLNGNMKVIGLCKIPIHMHSKSGKKKTLRPDCITVREFDFKKPFFPPKAEVLFPMWVENVCIALPDDRPASLRPWRSDRRCLTMYAGMPRISNTLDDYELPKEQIEKMERIKQFYINFIRNEAMKRERKGLVQKMSWTSYEVVCSEERCIADTSKKKKEKFLPDFLPLSPEQLFNITVTPRSVLIEQVVKNSIVTRSIKIVNKNNFAARIYLKPHRGQAFTFPHGSRQILKANSSIDVPYQVKTGNIAIINHKLDVVVNQTNVFQTSICIVVSPKILRFSTLEARFTQDDPPYMFLIMYNDLNDSITFEWTETSQINVTPLIGNVEPGKALTCLVSYDNGKCTLNNYELEIRMDGRKTQLFRIIIEKLNYNVEFVDEVDFGDVGATIDIVKTVMMYNHSCDPIWFELTTEDLPKELTIEPVEGVIPPNAIQQFTFLLNSAICKPFTCDLPVNIANTKYFNVRISGNVMFPKIHLQPETIRFRKMAASSYDVQCLLIKSLSDTVQAVISFDPEKISEFYFSEQAEGKFLTDMKFYLNPKDEKKIFIHFYPYYPIVTSIYLPIVINGKVSSIKIYIEVLTHKLSIKNWRYDFLYLPFTSSMIVTDQVISITNPGKTPVTFCIRLDELQQPFSFSHTVGGTITKHECSIECVVDPEEDVLFQASFLPDSPIQIEIRLPIFLRDDFVEDVHNYLYFKGIYPKAAFRPSKNVLFFGLLPLNFTFSNSLEISMTYHARNCKPRLICDDINITIVSMKISKVNDSLSNAVCNISYHSDDFHLLDSVVEMKCNCGASVGIKCYGASENCVATNFACLLYYRFALDKKIEEIFEYPLAQANSNSKTSIGSLYASKLFSEFKGENTFPNFPNGDDDYTRCMNKTVKLSEKWMYEQCFFGTTYCRIPETMSIGEVQMSSRTFMSKSKDGSTAANKVVSKRLKLPIFTMLYNIVGNQLNKIFHFELDSEENLCVFIYGLYVQLREFLIKLRGCVTHVSPELLLSYDDYKEFSALMQPDADILPYEEFYIKSKQHWLDVVMQIYKIFVHYRFLTYNSAFSHFSLKKISMPMSFGDKVRSQIVLNSSIFSQEAAFLLDWLNVCLVDQLDKLASCSSGQSTTPDHRTVENFESDLSDGLAFAAAIVYMCPFMEKYLDGIYVTPNFPEEYFHNVCCVLRLLTMLKFSFTMTPDDILEPNPAQMIPFTLYLYDFLIHLRIKETIHFQATLSESAKENILIGNEDHCILNYYIIFFDNEDEIFSLDHPNITIHPNRTKSLRVTFLAKFLKTYRATLILAGDIRGSRYSKSRAFALEGVPLLNMPTDSLELSSPIYKINPIILDFQSPYEEVADYEIFKMYEPPTDLENLNLIPCSKLKRLQTLSRLELDETNVISAENGKFSLSGTLCSFTNSTQLMWLFFRNPKTGDFMVKVKIEVEPSHVLKKLKLMLPDSFRSLNCKCKKKTHNPKCPKNVKVEVPCRNTQLWAAVISRTLTNCTDKDRIFWNEFQNTELGLHLIMKNLYDHKRLLSDDILYILKRSINFEVVSKTASVTFQPTVHVENAQSSDNFELNMHLKENDKKVMFLLHTPDGYEVRRYKLSISYDKK